MSRKNPGSSTEDETRVMYVHMAGCRDKFLGGRKLNKPSAQVQTGFQRKTTLIVSARC